MKTDGELEHGFQPTASPVLETCGAANHDPAAECGWDEQRRGCGKLDINRDSVSLFIRNFLSAGMDSAFSTMQGVRARCF
jgi:hypothetical protein